jgi:DNA-binding NarL/FixJ family response regulator
MLYQSAKKLGGMYSMKRKVCLVEDDDIIRNSYELIINNHDKYYVVGAYDNCEGFLKNAMRDSPDVVLMDINLPGMNGIEGISKLKKKLPNVEIIVFTVHEDKDIIIEALKAGATGYLLKHTKYAEVIEGLDCILEGGAPMSKAIARKLVGSFHRNHQSPLTARETEVLGHLSEGKSYTVIAEELYIGKETTKTHIKNIYSKLLVNSKADAIKVAKEQRWI